MAIDTLAATVTAAVSWNAEKIVTGTGTRKNTTDATKRFSFPTAGVGALAVNELYSTVLTIAGGATTTLDLTAALTNVVGDATITVARCKFFMIWLLSATDTAPDGTTTGTAATSITIGDAASNPFDGPLGGTDETYTITTGGVWLAARPDAAGWVIDGTHDQLKIVNDDGAVSAKVFIAMGLGAT